MLRKKVYVDFHVADVFTGFLSVFLVSQVNPVNVLKVDSGGVFPFWQCKDIPDICIAM